MTFIFYAASVSLVMAGVLLTVLVLIQKGRGGGLSNSLGGGGGSAAFGPRTGDVLTWVTAAIFVIVIALVIAVDLLVNSRYAH